MTAAAWLAAIAGACWPLASHAVTLAGRPDWLPGVTAVCASVISLALGAGARGAFRLAWFVVAAIAALAWSRFPAVLVFVPPVAINLAFGWLFASTLAAGREPRIATYARRERGGDLPEDLARYTRRLTWIWSGWFFVAAAADIVLAVAAPVVVWSAFANIASYAVVAALFVGEYGYRRLRFRHYAHAPLASLIAIVASERAMLQRAAR